jgi:aminomethyltransferase
MTSARRLLKRTPFYASHVERGAEMYEKGGWVRPARYPGGPVAEHLRVRSTGGIIDAHSMGKIVVEGPRAGALLEFAATGDIIGLAVGAARYTCLCAQDGGVLDDVIVYRTADEAFYLVTNTLSRERVLARLRAASDGGAHVQDVSSALAYIAVQGPATRSLLTRAGVEGELGGAVLPYLTCGRYRLHGVDVLLARTGYTGELGYELNFPAEYATDVWALLCDSGAALGIEPVGAQAMMTLGWRRATAPTAPTSTRRSTRWKPGWAGWSTGRSRTSPDVKHCWPPGATVSRAAPPACAERRV